MRNIYVVEKSPTSVSGLGYLVGGNVDAVYDTNARGDILEIGFSQHSPMAIELFYQPLGVVRVKY